MLLWALLPFMPMLAMPAKTRSLFSNRRPFLANTTTPRDCWGVHLNCCDLIDVNVTALLSSSGWGGREAGPLGVDLAEEEEEVGIKSASFRWRRRGLRASVLTPESSLR